MASAEPTRGGFGSASFEDSAFDPNPGFDFGEANDEEMRGMHDSIASLNMYPHGAIDQRWV